MRNVYLALIATTVLASQTVFAADAMGKDMEMGMGMPGDMNKSCAMIAKACKGAGFERKGDEGKKFWQDCMKPVVMGKTVEGVKLDASAAKDCRTFKIEKMKKELKEMESVK